MTTHLPAGSVHHLKDSDLRLADSRADIRDFQVVDRDGERLGKVEDLLVDDREQKVRFIEVGTGGFLGLGKKRFLLPVESVGEIRGELVRVNQSRERVTGSPKYRPRLSERPYLSRVYRYYGYRTPFWDAAYVPSRYPDL
jgi:sporulation protein YlmC with PRC-barrel domain